MNGIEKIIDDNLDYLMCRNQTLCVLYEFQRQKYEHSQKREDLFVYNYFKMELINLIKHRKLDEECESKEKWWR